MAIEDQTGGRVVRVGAVGDVHCGKTSQGHLQPLFARAAEAVDLLLLAGDLTDHGLAEEAQTLLRELTGLKVPVVAVLGNHDYHSGEEAAVRKVLSDGGIKVLDGDSFEFQGVGVAGVKGFCGGFGRGTLGAWGEPIVKQFVHEALTEVLKLEEALARLRTPRKIALLHYAPIQATVEGEPLEIYPFLGCGRLAEPLSRYAVDAVVHGHAHKGTPAGATADGIPVYNVSLPLLRAQPGAPVVKVLEMTIPESTSPSPGVAVPPAGT